MKAAEFEPFQKRALAFSPQRSAGRPFGSFRSGTDMQVSPEREVPVRRSDDGLSPATEPAGKGKTMPRENATLAISVMLTRFSFGFRSPHGKKPVRMRRKRWARRPATASRRIKGIFTSSTLSARRSAKFPASSFAVTWSHTRSCPSAALSGSAARIWCCRSTSSGSRATARRSTRSPRPTRSRNSPVRPHGIRPVRVNSVFGTFCDQRSLE